MRYISKVNGIQTSGVIEAGIAHGVIATLDSTSGKGLTTSSLSDVNARKTLGVANKYDKYYVVCHTIKTAMLYKYVEFVCCDKLIQLPFLTDLLYISPIFEPVFATSGEPCDCIAINTQSLTIQLHGLQGSVVTKSMLGSNTVTYLSLYDLLVEFCRLSGRNLLEYRTIRMYGIENVYTEIRFNHRSQDAKRFFMKMWMDIQGGA